MQHIRLAADLAVFDITLFAPGRRVNRGLIPLSTPGTLESTDHANIYRTRSYRWNGVAPGSSRFFRVVAVSVLRHAVFVLQHMSSRFFSAPRQFPSVCRAISSACGASVSSRFSTSALHPLRSGLIPCCFPPSSLQIGPSRRKVGRQTQNWFFTNLFGSAACLAQHLRNLLC